MAFLFSKYPHLKNEWDFKKNKEINEDIEDGDFRPIFLRQTPFNLPTPILKIFDKDEEHKNNSNLSCYLYLYSKNQLN